MFIGRQQELDTLSKLHNSGKFEFAVIYGRRRVGKTGFTKGCMDKRICRLSVYQPKNVRLLLAGRSSHRPPKGRVRISSR